MSIAVITGSTGLIGAEAVRRFAAGGLDVVGIDNDMRSTFFGPEASTDWCRRQHEATVKGYRHVDHDIRDRDFIVDLFRRHGPDIKVVIHAAAQPSHDWAAQDPQTDFTVNANGTLNLLEATRLHCPDAPFIFTSTNKVYGDTPNRLPLVEQETRMELLADHAWGTHGIDESMSIDHTLHSLFGVSKAAADLLTQEYGRYFGMNTACFRGGCLTGSGHAGAELHGFLAYLMKCAVTGRAYTIFGYDGKQVRDNIHCVDLVEAFWHFFQAPRSGEVYNIGGGRHANCSMLEAIGACEKRAGRPLDWSYDETNRSGDHIWWISDTRRFRSHFPKWNYRYDMEAIYDEVHEGIARRAEDV
jgi:CDP-paratose 2-epimerase